MPIFLSNLIAHLHIYLYTLQMRFSTISTHHLALAALIGAVLTPLVFILFLFIAATDDFLEIIRLKVGFSRLFGDLFKVFLIVVFGFLMEIAFLYELFVYFF